MRTIEYGTTTTTHVPAFLTKLWKLVTDVSCNELICWSLAGTSFIIYDEIRFSKELLPLYFKHNNMASFVRQLNMYGFRKLSCIDQGGMHCYKSEIEFYHQYFIKGQEKLLELIKRKIPHSKSDEPKVKQEYIDELITSIKTLKGKQDCAEQGMRHLRRENRVLWRQVNLLTERYSKQQAVIQQLLPYFLGMIRSRQELTMKRKSTMALPETDTHNKVARLSPPYYVQEDSNSCMPPSPGNVSNRGPVIHDVTEMENSKMYPGPSVFCPPSAKEGEAVVDSPLSCSLESPKQSPYTDPGSMETLNILNQNYERRNRSNSLSPNMGLQRSPQTLGAPVSSIRLPSPASMPGASNSMPCFTSASPNSCMSSPTNVIIDEATNDVPPQMMRPFIPKVEDTCNDSGMYSMGPMMSERLMNDETVSSLLEERAAAMMGNGGSTMMGNGGPTMMGNGGPTMMGDMAQEDNGSKFPSASFLANIKNDMTEINWMMNQSAPSSYAAATASASEPTLENWLGQIFKSDNLTAGCSLPHSQQQVPVENVNFV
ncbi:hypothetical protein JTE90_020658 [Oedothorax gibbosus]|uniref:HSF-type DNA-binding domain-containing protein n=1 Tax=Oedothorax gibbosus TaxID=931172 RepID=A0AAV6USN8_9ARAC|nr:hypothetical protein JTE90_020658 [Oedothorax gibbosus]